MGIPVLISQATVFWGRPVLTLLLVAAIILLTWLLNRHYEFREEPTLDAQLEWLEEKKRKEKEAKDININI